MQSIGQTEDLAVEEVEEQEGNEQDKPASDIEADELMAEETDKEDFADFHVSFSARFAKYLGVYGAIIAPFIDQEILRAHPEFKYSYKYAKGRWWARISLEDFKIRFPFFSDAELIRTIRGLEKYRYSSHNAGPGNDYAERWYSLQPDVNEKWRAEGVEIPPAPKRSNPGYVYLLHGNGHYKIGKTKSISRRFREVGLKLPFPVEIEDYIRCDDMDSVEAEWHSRFKDKRLHGEWFNLSAEDVAAFVKAANA